MNLAPLAIQKFFDNAGRPAAGYKLFTYIAGTTTKLATYTSNTGAVQNTNPIILDFRGECRLWIDPTLNYKFVLAPDTDTDPPTAPIWTVDNITAAPLDADYYANDTGPANNIQLSIPRAPAPAAGLRLVFKAAATNTASTTLALNGGTAYSVTGQDLAALQGAEIQINGIYEVVFDGARWQLQAFSGVYVGTGRNTGNARGTAVGKGALQSTGAGEDNTAIGWGAMSVASGLRSTAVGSRSMLNATSAYQCVAVGNESMKSITIGSRCVAVGESALFSLVDFAECTAVGAAALFSCNAHKNTAVGREAGYYVSSGEMNVYLGYDCGINQTTGNHNVGVGAFALQGQQTAGVGSSIGIGNSVVGWSSCAQLTTGDYNCTLGWQAATALTTGDENVSIGKNSMLVATSASSNVGVGTLTLEDLTTGGSNTAVGTGALGSVTTGGSNSGFGPAAGSAITTGNYNVVIGGNSGSSIATLSNRIIISDGQGNSRITIDNNSKATFAGAIEIPTASYFIGNAANGYRFNNAADSATRMTLSDAGALRLHTYGAGTLQSDASGNITSVSDERLKERIRSFDAGLEALQKIQPILYKFTKESGLDQSKTDYAGFSAQNVRRAIPEAVNENESGILSLDDRALIAALVNGVNELAMRLAKLEAIEGIL